MGIKQYGVEETAIQYLLLNCYLQKRPLSTVERMVTGFGTQTPTGLGPTIHSAMKTLRQSLR